MTTDSDWEWPRDLFSARAPETATKIARLIADESLWVDRRVETVSYVDEDTLHRHVSVHFSVPNLPQSDFDPDGVVLSVVPIAMIQKAVLRNFDIRDDGGRALPMLTRELNSAIGAEILRQQAIESLKGTPDPDPVAEVIATLSYVAGVRAQHADDDTDGSVDGVRERQEKHLVEDPTMFAFILNLAWHFLMLVPYAVKAGETHLIKFAYESDFNPGYARAQHDAESVSLTRRLWGGVKNFVQFFGLIDFKTGFGAPAVFDAQSYHVEIVAPSEVKISEAVLYRVDRVIRVEQRQWRRVLALWRWLRSKRDKSDDEEPQRGDAPIEGSECPPEADASARQSGSRSASSVYDELDEPDEDIPQISFELVDRGIAHDFAADRAHLYTDGDSPANATHAYVAINFCLRVPIVLPVLLLTAVTTATLAGGLLAHYHFALSRSGDTAAALIVALPTFFVPTVIPGDHRLVRRMFKGMRTIVFASAVVSFSAATSLAIRLSTADRVSVWWWLLGISSGLTLLSLLACTHSWWKTTQIQELRRQLRWSLFLITPCLALAAVVGRVKNWDWLGHDFAWGLVIAAATGLVSAIALVRVSVKARDPRRRPIPL